MKKEKKKSCSLSLIRGLQNKTKMFYPRCLKYINYVETYKVSEDELKICTCGKLGIKEINVFNFKYDDKDIYFNIGSVCIDRITEDKTLIDDVEIYKHWEKQAIKAINGIKSIRNTNKKCNICFTPWTYKYCFRDGLCSNCRIKKNKLNELLKTKIILPKYNGLQLKDIVDNIKYIEFCIENKTRQHKLFMEYIELKNNLKI